eukprot:scaffold1090_cov244-Chaetoceros_neogracile.AAC.13
MPTVHSIQTTNRVLEGEDAAPDGTDNTVIDTPAEDTNAGSDEVTEKEMGAYYYYYTYTDGTEDSAPDGNDNTVIDTPAEDTNAGSDEVLVEEVDTYYYYYTYPDDTDTSTPDGNDNTVIDTPAEDTNAGSNEVTEEEEIYYYYYTYPDDTDASTPDGNDNTVIDTPAEDTNAGSDEVIEEEEIYYYYTDTDDTDASTPDGNDNTVIDTSTDDTNTGSDEVTEEEEIYYYYTDTDDTDTSTPDGNDNIVIDTSADDTNTGSDKVTEEEEIYYYYTDTDDTDASTPDGNDNTVIDTSTDDTNTGSDEVTEEAVDSNAEVTLDADDKIEGTDTSIAEGTDGRDSVEEQFTSRRCPLAYLTKNTIHMDDLSFTFAIEADTTMVDEVITKARSGLLDNISDTSLACAVNRKRRLSGPDHPAGIYEIRYLEKEDMKKVSECYQSIHGNSCFVYTGILRLISDQTITLDEHNLVSTRIQNYVNSVEIGVDNVSSSVYLGPEIPHVSLAPKNNTVDHSAIAISVSFFIALLLFVVYNYKISRTRKRRVTFNLEE